MNDYPVKFQNKCFVKIYTSLRTYVSNNMKMAQVNNRTCNKVTFGEKLRIFPTSEIKKIKERQKYNLAHGIIGE